jgi:hypothetical protein
VGHDNDQFIYLSQTVAIGGESEELKDNPIIYVPAGIALQDGSLPPILAEVDPIAGTASLKVFGFVFRPGVGIVEDRILAATTYTLRSGESCLRITTTATNTSGRPADVAAIGDLTLLATGGLLPFIASPALGIAIPEAAVVAPYLTLLGRVSPEDGVVDTAAMVDAGEVSYTIVSPEQGLLVTYGTPVFFTIRTPRGPTPLPPDGGLTYERRIFIGPRNDVASSANQALQELDAAFGLPGGTVQGRLVVSDGLPMRASVEMTLVDLDPSTPEPTTLVSALTGDLAPEPLSHVLTGSLRDGVFEAVLPAGRYELNVKAEEREDIGPVGFTLPPNGHLDLGDMPLSSLGRLRFGVSDSKLGRRIPAKLTVKGRNGSPDPELGVPIDVRVAGQPVPTQASHANPALNMAYTATGEGEVFLRPLDYRVYASRGLEYSYGETDVTIAEGQTAVVDLAIDRVVDTGGYVSADFHVHSAQSPDSSVPPFDRVLNFAAEGVEIMVASDHNTNFDYQPLTSWAWDPRCGRSRESR